MSENELKVLEVLREHPRSILTIVWGIYTLYKIEVDAHVVIHILEDLEKQGLAARAMDSTGTWWKRAI